MRRISPADRDGKFTSPHPIILGLGAASNNFGTLVRELASSTPGHVRMRAGAQAP